MDQARELAGPGHNKPPLDLSERLAILGAPWLKQAEAIAARANDTPAKIASEDDLKTAGEIAIDARGLHRGMDAARTLEKAPFLESGRQVDEYFRAALERVKRIYEALEQRAGNYHKAIAEETRRKAQEEARERQAEAERQAELARKAEEAGRPKAAAAHAAKAEAHDDAATQARQTSSAAVSAEQTFSGGMKATAKGEEVAEITDYAKIDLEKLRPYFKREHVDSALKIAVKMGIRDIAGVTFSEVVKAKFRR